jgi:hypothetical protein
MLSKLKGFRSGRQFEAFFKHTHNLHNLRPDYKLQGSPSFEITECKCKQTLKENTKAEQIQSNYYYY